MKHGRDPDRYLVVLRPLPGAGVTELRQFLKLALRRFRLRCVEVRSVSDRPSSESKKLQEEV